MYDKEIGMYYLIARYYNPEHGVFLSVEPDGHAAIAGVYLIPGVGQAALSSILLTIILEDQCYIYKLKKLYILLNLIMKDLLGDFKKYG